MFKTMLKSESLDSEPESLRMMSELSKKPKIFRRSVTVPAEITSSTRSDPEIMDMDAYDEMVILIFFLNPIKPLPISCLQLLFASSYKNTSRYFCVENSKMGIF